MYICIRNNSKKVCDTLIMYIYIALKAVLILIIDPASNLVVKSFLVLYLVCYLATKGFNYKFKINKDNASNFVNFFFLTLCLLQILRV